MWLPKRPLPSAEQSLHQYACTCVDAFAREHIDMAPAFFTVGHSTRTIEEFVALLQAARVTRVIDIRSVARSRTNPQYNEESLPTHLAPFNIDYQHIAALGGLRNRSKEISPEVNGFWENRSFHNYADYALTDAFRTGLEELMARGRQQRCAIMCAEAVWWHCHRRIVVDHLIAHGEPVFHLMGKDKIDPAQLTRSARLQEGGLVTYPVREPDD
ncbi:MAG TPA: DUF488 domain-containing protein [Halomonas sp.]|nr:DUF488 domain-containing protein [Halomonas sp.]